MATSVLRNPYDYANPVSDPKIFSGRHDALAKIAYLLDQAGIDTPTRYLAVHGKRAAGKTSLLNMAEMIACQKGYLTVRIDLVVDDSSSVKFYTKLYEELIYAVGQACDLRSLDGQEITPKLVRRIIGGRHVVDSAVQLEFPESLTGARTDDSVSEIALRGDLEYLAAQVGKPIALLIDEAQVIANREEILSILRTIGMRLKGYVFIIAGTDNLVQTINGVFGHLLRQFELVAVDRFIELSDAEECISRPLASLGLVPADCFRNLKDTANDLVHLTDGNPYEIQLYCHVMFARWQTGVARAMELSAKLLEEVLELLEARTGAGNHALLVKIKKMPTKNLMALNIICSSIGRANLEEIWAAHSLYGQPGLSKADLDGQVAALLEAEIIEIDDGRIKFLGDHFEEIFARILAVQKMGKLQTRGQHRHLELLGHVDFRHVLTRNLEYLLCDINLSGLKILETCCFGLKKESLDQGIVELEQLKQTEKLHYTTAFLHEAIVRTKLPEILRIKEVTCAINDTKAVRWLYVVDEANSEIDTCEGFKDAVSRISALGGQLYLSDVEVRLRPYSEILEWISSTESTRDNREKISQHHIVAALGFYSIGDVHSAVTHFEAALKVNKCWEAANDLAYMMLKDKRYEESLVWGKQAVTLGETPKELALSRYNSSMANLSLRNLADAQKDLAAASAELDRLAFREAYCFYLLLPKLEGDDILLCEKEDVNLPSAVAEANDLVDLAVRLDRIKKSSH